MIKNRSASIFLSLVIPVYNEQKRISRGLNTALEYLMKQPLRWELIIVDDGSEDETHRIVQERIRGMQGTKVVQHKRNLGKGAAIRSGMLVAKGKYVVFSDIDFSTPITELPKLLKTLKKNEVAIGVRRHPQSKVKKHQPLIRESLGQVFTKLTNWLVTPGIYDVTCGFKGFRSSAARKIFSHTKIDRWAFDAEVLYLARQFGFKIAQVPVVWSDNSNTKVNMARDGWQAFWDLLKLKGRSL